jgi:hypothetical protein
MKLEAISRILWIKVIEESDTKGEILPYFIRESHQVKMRSAEAFHDRAVAFLDWLKTSKHRPLARLPLLPRFFLNRPLFIVLALITGGMLNLLGDQHRIQLLMNPFIFLWLWNFTLFGVLFFFMLFKKKGQSGSPGFFVHALDGMSQWRWIPKRIKMQIRFLIEWGKTSPDVLKRFVEQDFHLGALCMLGGAIAGLYLRGFLVNYTFTWESTSLKSPDELQSVLNLFFAPASWVLRAPVPVLPAQGLAMRGDLWIHIFALTSLLYVGIPRTFLIVFSSLHSGSDCVVSLSSAYFHQAVRGIRTVFLSFSFQLELPQMNLLKAELGINNDVMQEMVLWGDALRDKMVSEGIFSEEQLADQNGINLRLFAMFLSIQTPEEEIHGAALSGLSGIDTQILLIEGEGSCPVSDTRLDLWKNLFAKSGFNRMILVSFSPEIQLREVEW